ncbi:hypothetical protein [Chishuiella sp.]|uniref:hypothetical protein n=1 Tax=Chishuiella sp. TaxID=1969467 RepID=UPI0028ADE657|nr:hypothetical protein [Chishuiella sp.]
MRKPMPINGLEHECTSKVGRKMYCYIKNVRGIRKFVKKTMNRRFRKEAKQNLLDE